MTRKKHSKTSDGFEDKFRELLNDEGMNDSYIAEILPELCSAVEYNLTDAGGYDDEEEAFDAVAGNISDLASYSTEGHSVRFVAVAARNPDYIENEIYSEMSGDEILEDLESLFETRGFSEAAIEYLREHASDFVEIDSLTKVVETYEEAYTKELEDSNDEEKAKAYAEKCSYRGELFETDDNLEEFLRNGEPWRCVTVYGCEPFRDGETYSADDILDWYYEQSDTEIDYTEGDTEFSMGDWDFIEDGFLKEEDEEYFYG